MYVAMWPSSGQWVQVKVVERDFPVRGGTQVWTLIYFLSSFHPEMQMWLHKVPKIKRNKKRLHYMFPLWGNCLQGSSFKNVLIYIVFNLKHRAWNIGAKLLSFCIREIQFYWEILNLKKSTHRYREQIMVTSDEGGEGQHRLEGGGDTNYRI